MTPETKASLSALGVLAFGGIAYGLTGSIYSSAEAQVLVTALSSSVGEFDKLPPQWYPTLYKVLLAFMVGISALMVGTVVMLYQTVVTLIANITPTEDV